MNITFALLLSVVFSSASFAATSWKSPSSSAEKLACESAVMNYKISHRGASQSNGISCSIKVIESEEPYIHFATNVCQELGDDERFSSACETSKVQIEITNRGPEYRFLSNLDAKLAEKL